MLTKRKEGLEGLCKKNSVRIEEIKEISEVLNYGEQLGTSQIVTTNIRNSVKLKEKKKAQKQHLSIERKT
jgi:hypothetical protein